LLLTIVLASAGVAFPQAPAPDLIVAADGSGHFKKVQDAINAVAGRKSTRTVVYIKAGTYKEKILVAAAKKNVTLIGESRENTILTFDDYQGKASNSASTKVDADDFSAENITFENTFDSRTITANGQAHALEVNGDRAAFHKCKITGFQDTYYLKGHKRAYMKDCIIDGTTDFIFGPGIALFENCLIRSRKNSHITAQSQEPNTSKFGFVFDKCELTVYPGEKVDAVSLGRPWAAGSRVVYLNTVQGAHIKPEGWSVWSTDPSHKYFNNHKQSFYAEYKCSGPGYQPEKRVSWSRQLTDAEAAAYTKANIFKANTTTAVTLQGDWNPEFAEAVSIGGHRLGLPATQGRHRNPTRKILSISDAGAILGNAGAFALDGSAALRGGFRPAPASGVYLIRTESAE
jgi:pectinesterase